MGRSTIPVDLLNPGQVFACLGLLEAAEVLLGEAEGGFQWEKSARPTFVLQATGDVEPVQQVLERLAKARIKEVEPRGWPEEERASDAVVADCFPSAKEDHYDKKEKKWKRTALPVTIEFPGEPCRSVILGNWCDASSRPLFKLYSGNRSACSIARDMLRGKRGNPTRKDPEGKVENPGLCQLWDGKRADLIADPLNAVCAMGGRFNFDPRGGWSSINTGFSPDKQDKLLAGVSASPVVELLAAWGVEHARPPVDDEGDVRYAVWRDLVPPMLARAAMFGGYAIRPFRRFRFRLGFSGKNKLVTFATEENSP
jgi:CRISPR-associated protein Csx14